MAKVHSMQFTSQVGRTQHRPLQRKVTLVLFVSYANEISSFTYPARMHDLVSSEPASPVPVLVGKHG